MTNEELTEEILKRVGKLEHDLLRPRILAALNAAVVQERARCARMVAEDRDAESREELAAKIRGEWA